VTARANIDFDMRQSDRSERGWYRLTWDGRTIDESADCDALCNRARRLGPGALVCGAPDPIHPGRDVSAMWYSPR
jgi:hypothetical protein